MNTSLLESAEEQLPIQPPGQIDKTFRGVCTRLDVAETVSKDAATQAKQTERPPQCSHTVQHKDVKGVVPKVFAPTLSAPN